jgi:hypothetical protein
VAPAPGRIGSGGAAVGQDDLAVDPAGRAGQERDDLGDVGGGAEALQRGRGGGAVDGGLVLALEVQGGGGRAGGNGVDGDVAAPQLTGQDQGQRLDRALAGGVGTVAGRGQPGDAAGEVDDLARAWPPWPVISATTWSASAVLLT